MEKKHNYGIDLLRLILMYMVITLHILNQGGVLSNLKIGTLQYSVYWFIQIFSFCAVDVFVLITGYMSTNKPIKFDRLISYWFQTFFYSFIITLVLALLGLAGDISIIEIIKTAFPISFDFFWFMSAFFLLYLLKPLLNRYLFKLDEKHAKKTFIIILLIYELLYILLKKYRFLLNKSALLLVFLYCLGVLGKKIKIFSKTKTSVLIFTWLLLTFISWYFLVFFKTGFFVDYASFTVLFSGYIMVILFSRLNVKSKIISKLAPLTLGVYLFHANYVIWAEYITGDYIFIAFQDIYLGIILLVLVTLSFYCLGLLVEYFRSKLAEALKIDLLSEKIINLINKK